MKKLQILCCLWLCFCLGSIAVLAQCPITYTKTDPPAAIFTQCDAPFTVDHTATFNMNISYAPDGWPTESGYDFVQDLGAVNISTGGGGFGAPIGVVPAIGCYDLTLTDSWGDGHGCYVGSGSTSEADADITLIDAYGALIAESQTNASIAGPNHWESPGGCGAFDGFTSLAIGGDCYPAVMDITLNGGSIAAAAANPNAFQASTPIDPAALAAGPYTIEWSYTDGDHGCVSTMTFDFVILEEPDITALTNTLNGDVCGVQANDTWTATVNDPDSAIDGTYYTLEFFVNGASQGQQTALTLAYGSLDPIGCDFMTYDVTVDLICLADGSVPDSQAETDGNVTIYDTFSEITSGDGACTQTVELISDFTGAVCASYTATSAVPACPQAVGDPASTAYNDVYFGGTGCEYTFTGSAEASGCPQPVPCPSCDIVIYQFGGAGYGECQNIQDDFDNACITDPDYCTLFGGSPTTNPFGGFPGFSAAQDPCTPCAAVSTGISYGLQPVGCDPPTNSVNTEVWAYGADATLDPCAGTFDGSIPNNNDGLIDTGTYWDHPDADGCSPVWFSTAFFIQVDEVDNTCPCEGACVASEQVNVLVNPPCFAAGTCEFDFEIVNGTCDVLPSVNVTLVNTGTTDPFLDPLGAPVTCLNTTITSDVSVLPGCNQAGNASIDITILDQMIIDQGLETICPTFPDIAVPYSCVCCEATGDFSAADICSGDNPTLVVGPDCTLDDASILFAGPPGSAYIADVYWYAPAGVFSTTDPSTDPAFFVAPPGGTGDFNNLNPDLVWSGIYEPFCTDKTTQSAPVNNTCGPQTYYMVAAYYWQDFNAPDTPPTTFGGYSDEECGYDIIPVTIWPATFQAVLTPGDCANPAAVDIVSLDGTTCASDMALAPPAAAANCGEVNEEPYDYTFTAADLSLDLAPAACQQSFTGAVPASCEGPACPCIAGATEVANPISCCGESLPLDDTTADYDATLAGGSPDEDFQLGYAFYAAGSPVPASQADIDAADLTVAATADDGTDNSAAYDNSCTGLLDAGCYEVYPFVSNQVITDLGPTTQSTGPDGTFFLAPGADYYFEELAEFGCLNNAETPATVDMTITFLGLVNNSTCAAGLSNNWYVDTYVNGVYTNAFYQAPLVAGSQIVVSSADFPGVDADTPISVQISPNWDFTCDGFGGTATAGVDYDMSYTIETTVTYNNTFPTVLEGDCCSDIGTPATVYVIDEITALVEPACINSATEYEVTITPDGGAPALATCFPAAVYDVSDAAATGVVDNTDGTWTLTYPKGTDYAIVVASDDGGLIVSQDATDGCEMVFTGTAPLFPAPPTMAPAEICQDDAAGASVMATCADCPGTPASDSVPGATGSVQVDADNLPVVVDFGSNAQVTFPPAILPLGAIITSIDFTVSGSDFGANGDDVVLTVNGNVILDELCGFPGLSPVWSGSGTVPGIPPTTLDACGNVISGPTAFPVVIETNDPCFDDVVGGADSQVDVANITYNYIMPATGVCTPAILGAPGSVTWWDAATGGTEYTNGAGLSSWNPVATGDVDETVAGVTTLYAQCDCSGCLSDRAMTTFTVHPIPDPFDYADACVADLASTTIAGTAQTVSGTYSIDPIGSVTIDAASGDLDVSAVVCTDAPTTYTITYTPDAPGDACIETDEVLITPPACPPSATTGFEICLNDDAGGDVTATCADCPGTPATADQTGSETITLTAADYPTLDFGNTSPVSINLDFAAAGIPAGATVTNVSWGVFSGLANETHPNCLAPTGWSGSWASEAGVSISGPDATYSGYDGGNGLLGPAGPWTYGPGVDAGFNGENASGVWTITYQDLFDDIAAGTAACGSAAEDVENTITPGGELTVEWIILGSPAIPGAAATVIWWDAETGGTEYTNATGGTWNPVTTGDVDETVAGTTSLWAQCVCDGCPSTRVEAEFTVHPIPDPFDYADACVADLASTTIAGTAQTVSGTYSIDPIGSVTIDPTSGDLDVSAVLCTEAPTTYTITFTPDAPGDACIETDEVLITPPACPPSATTSYEICLDDAAGGDVTATCADCPAGGAATVTWWDAETGGTEYTNATGGTWNPVTTGDVDETVAGTTSLWAQCACNGCPSTRVEAEFIVRPEPTAPILTAIDPFCEDLTPYPTITPGAGTYNFYRDGAAITGAQAVNSYTLTAADDETTITATELIAGDPTIPGIADPGCESAASNGIVIEILDPITFTPQAVCTDAGDYTYTVTFTPARGADGADADYEVIAPNGTISPSAIVTDGTAVSIEYPIGTAWDITVQNAAAVGTPDACPVQQTGDQVVCCPGATVADAQDLCQGEVPDLRVVQTFIDPIVDTNGQLNTTDGNNGADTGSDGVVWFMENDPFGTAYSDAAIVPLDACTEQTYTLYSFLQCDKDGDLASFDPVAGAGLYDDEWIAVGSIDVTIYPEITGSTGFPDSAVGLECRVEVFPSCDDFTIDWVSADQAFGAAASPPALAGPPFVFDPDQVYAPAASIGTVDFTIINPNAPPAISAQCVSIDLPTVEYTCCIAESGYLETNDVCPAVYEPNADPSVLTTAGTDLVINVTGDESFNLYSSYLVIEDAATGLVTDFIDFSAPPAGFNVYAAGTTTPFDPNASASPGLVNFDVTIPYDYWGFVFDGICDNAENGLDINLYIYNQFDNVPADPGIVIGQPADAWDSNSDICADLSESVNFYVPGPQSAVGGIVNNWEGNEGGIIPFYYNTNTIDICGGTLPYTYEWYRDGYVRHAITGTGEIRVIYSDDALWSVTVSDASGCQVTEWVFTNDYNNDPALGEQNPILDIEDFTITPDVWTTLTSYEGQIEVRTSGNGDCGTHDYSWVGPVGYSNTATIATGPSADPLYEESVHVISGLRYGWYTVTVTDCNMETTGWYWVPRTHNVGGAGTDRGKFAESAGLTAYPNPFVGETTIDFSVNESGTASLSLFAIDGAKVLDIYSGQVEKGIVVSTPFQAGPLPVGMYLLQLELPDGSVLNEKLILNK